MANLATYNAGVTVVIVGISTNSLSKRKLYDADSSGKETLRIVDNIGPYLVAGSDVVVHPLSSHIDGRGKMIRGNMPNDGGHLILNFSEADHLRLSAPCSEKFIRYFIGSQEFIHSTPKYCIWIEEAELQAAMDCPPIKERMRNVRDARLKGGKQARDNASTPHRLYLRRIKMAVRLLYLEYLQKTENFFLLELRMGTV